MSDFMVYCTDAFLTDKKSGFLWGEVVCMFPAVRADVRATEILLRCGERLLVKETVSEIRDLAGVFAP